MEDRVKIGDIWYVKETKPEKEEVEIEITDTIACITEDDNWCFNASVLINNDDAIYLCDHNSEPMIVVTDKRKGDRDSWTESYVDNLSFMKGVLSGSVEAISEAQSFLDEEGFEFFEKFLKHLVEKGWIK